MRNSHQKGEIGRKRENGKGGMKKSDGRAGSVED